MSAASIPELESITADSAAVDPGTQKGKESKVDIPDVTFVPEVEKEKDAKVDIITYPSTKPKEYVGLGKDELQYYVNDAFWVRLRWILFISFWLLWLALLAAAMLIIFLSPGCELASTTETIEDAITQTHHI